MNEDGSQNIFWQKFYENAWNFRGNFLQSCLDDGLSPYQAIKRLQAKERKYTLRTNKDGDVAWFPIQSAGFYMEIPASGTPAFRKSACLGNPIIVPFHTQNHAHDLIIDIIDERGPYDAIVELGCGYGRNLFELFYAGGPTNIPYFGGEFTKSGVAIAQKLADAVPEFNAQFFHFNHLTPELFQDFGERVLFFTVHSIEQVTKIPSKWFSVVANAAKDVTCIHVEPFGFQLDSSGKASQNHLLFFQQNKWNMNLAHALQKAQDDQTILLETCMRDILLSTDDCNMSSLAIWTNQNN